MKANEAPDKLYLSKNIYSTYLYQVPDPDDETAVEYTRSDVFIKKACEFLKREIYTFCFDDMDKMIVDFKNYMKGE